MHLVTTMNFKVHDAFGHRLLDSIQTYSSNIPLIVYTEDKDFASFLSSKYKNVTPKLFSKKLFEFIAKIDSPRQLGFKTIGIKKIERFLKILFKKGRLNYQDYFYDFLFDSKRFSLKSFAFADALKTISDNFFYLDADCHIEDVIPAEINDGSYFDGFDYGYFGRDTYTETGIIFFSNGNLRMKVFGQAIEDYYLSGKIYSLKFWTDCHVFDQVRIDLMNSFNGKNLSPDTSFSHPIAISDFSCWIDHRKGPRKKEQRSPERNAI